jgi:predicted transcriptional regulator
MVQTMLVRDYMSRRLTTLDASMEILSAVHILVDKNLSGAPVIDTNDQLLGILTTKDCMKVVLNAAYHSEYGGNVRDYMGTDVITVTSTTGIVDVAQNFLTKRYHRYPVVDDGTLVGVISRRDVLRALENAWQWNKT